jgi:hypothetical protein
VITACSTGEILWIDMFENQLCMVSTRKMKLTLKSVIIYQPESSRLREKMLINILQGQSVTIISIKIDKFMGKTMTINNKYGLTAHLGLFFG